MEIKFHTMVVGASTPTTTPQKRGRKKGSGGTQRLIAERIIPQLDIMPDGKGVEVHDVNKGTWALMECRFPELQFVFTHTHDIYSQRAAKGAGGWVGRYKVHVSKRATADIGLECRL